MARAGLTRQRVVDLAVELVDDGGVRGFDDLTLAAVAGRAGVAVPSLYKHVGSLEDLRRAIAIRSLGELREAIVTASLGRAGSDAFHALAGAYRSFAQQYPGRYLATQVRFADAPPGGDGTERGRAAAAVVAVVAAVLAGYGVPEERMVVAIRAIRSGLHGFVALELAGGFGLPTGIDDSFEFLVTTLDAGIRSTAVPG